MEETLAELEVDHLPMVVALNKADKLPADCDPIADLGILDPTVLVSARTGQGIEALLSTLETVMTQTLRPLHVVLPYKRGDLLSMVYERGQVEEEKHSVDGVEVFGRLPGRLLPYFEPYKVADDQDAP